VSGTTIVVIGANGQLGSDLCRQFQAHEHRLVPMTRHDIELRDHDQVARTMEAVRPSVIVNTAAFHKVEACEMDVDQAFQVNSIGVRNLAVVAERIGALLVHMSTDYVFDGESDKPYPETAAPNPINVYGASKVAGEYFVRNICSRHLIVRTSGLYGLAGSSGKGGNFVETMLRLGRERGIVSVVSDQSLSPTYTPDLAEMIWRLVEAEAQGLYHVTNSDSCSWYEFACAIFDLSRAAVAVKAIDTAATGASVRRPQRSILANRRLAGQGIGPLRPWKQALASYLDQRSAIDIRRSTIPVGVENADN
jgi:dTDP-4-dehydrorhamnose reductase